MSVSVQESVVWVPAVGADRGMLAKYGIVRQSERVRNNLEECELLLPETFRVIERSEDYPGKLDILCYNINLDRYERLVVVRREIDKHHQYLQKQAAAPLITKAVTQLYVKIQRMGPNLNPEKLEQIDPKILKNLLGGLRAVVRDNCVIDSKGYAKQIHATELFDATDHNAKLAYEQATSWLTKNHCGWDTISYRTHT